MALTRRWLVMVQRGSSVITGSCNWCLCGDLWGNGMLYFLLDFSDSQASHSWGEGGFIDLSPGIPGRKGKAWLGDGDSLSSFSLGCCLVPILSVWCRTKVARLQLPPGTIFLGWKLTWSFGSPRRVCTGTHCLNMKWSHTDLKGYQKKHFFLS